MKVDRIPELTKANFDGRRFQQGIDEWENQVIEDRPIPQHIQEKYPKLERQEELEASERQ